MTLEKKQPNVYLVNDGMHDYSSAESFGNITFLSKEYINKMSVTQITRVFEEKLRDSQPEDLIIQGGPNVMLTIACAIFARKHNRLNFLIFKNGKYHRRTVVFERSSDEN